MDNSVSIELEIARQKLLKNKLGELFAWQAPAVVKSVGPFDPAVFEKFKQDCRAIEDVCRAQLSELTDSEIEILLTRKASEELICREWGNFQETPIYHLQRRIPIWYAGGFGHPDHVADFVYWAKMPRFSVHEISCLSVGIEPDTFTKQKLDDYSRMSGSRSAPIAFLLRQIDLIRRRFDPYFSDAAIEPDDFLPWADRVELEVHPEFTRLLRQYLPQSGVANTSTPPKSEPHKREIDMIAQLFTALAIDQLGYVPTHPRSPIPKEIADMAAKLGLAGTDDSVRKYLRIGASFLPEGWQKD
ncbi:hypothetical protein [Neogemmobacter tilapiae]|nr:hypothetical protein [Gemmobacter tilapiae]